jgi:hypothetical protein
MYTWIFKLAIGNNNQLVWLMVLGLLILEMLILLQVMEIRLPKNSVLAVLIVLAIYI